MHHHQKDESYDTVILHAVYEDDFAVYRTDGTLIPTLLLKDLLPESQFATYKRLLRARSFFPCAGQVKNIDDHTVNEMFTRMILERFEEKANGVSKKSAQNNNNWNETFYYLMMRNFGFNVNAVPFELLADALPSNVLLKHRDNTLQVEALLFGQAGFLNADFKDLYPQQLKSEYNFLRKKYNLRPIAYSLWKFLRVRPQNFPGRRIAQLAALLLHRHQFLPWILENTELKNLKMLFRPFAINEYWKTHSHFDRPVKAMDVQFGEKSIENLIINTVCLSLYSYGKYFKQEHLVERAFLLLKNIPAERNAIADKYNEFGLAIKNAYQSQAVLQLNKNYCSQKKCLNCNIGIKILNQ